MRFQAWLTGPRVFIFGVPRRGLRECRQVAGYSGIPRLRLVSISIPCRIIHISAPLIIMISRPRCLVWFLASFTNGCLAEVRVSAGPTCLTGTVGRVGQITFPRLSAPTAL